MAWNGVPAGSALPWPYPLPGRRGRAGDQAVPRAAFRPGGTGGRPPAAGLDEGAGATGWERAGTPAADGSSWAEPAFLARLRAGDEQALHALAAEWGPRLYRYGLRLGADAEQAQDLTQEALVRVLRAVRAGRGPERIAPWLYRIMTNLVRDEARSSYRQRVDLAPAVEEGAGRWLAGGSGTLAADPAEVVAGRSEARQRREALHQALRALPPALREVVVLRILEERPVAEVAAILEVPEGTVKSRLHRALKALRQALAHVPALADGRTGGRAGVAVTGEIAGDKGVTGLGGA